jgi:hypothetical protein
MSGDTFPSVTHPASTVFRTVNLVTFLPMVKTDQRPGNTWLLP